MPYVLVLIYALLWGALVGLCGLLRYDKEEGVVVGGYREFVDRMTKPLTQEELDHVKEAPTALYRKWSPDLPTLKYREGGPRTALHMGQRKLLLAEVEFLTLYGHLSNTVLYIGSAPGTHLVLLCRWFPRHKFICYDRVRQDPRVYDMPGVEIHREYFTDNHTRLYAGKKLLLMTDLRNLEIKRHNIGESEDIIEDDMDMQMRWWKEIEPAMAMLKFRLSWKANETTYLDGDIYIQPWAPPHSTELRLMVAPGAAMVTHNNDLVADTMFFHNTITRCAYFPYSDKISVKGADHCYDCASEFHILGEYCRKILGMEDEDRVAAKVSELSTATNDFLLPLSRLPHVNMGGERDNEKRLAIRLAHLAPE